MDMLYSKLNLFNIKFNIYSFSTIVESIKLIQKNGGKHGRIVITIEACEESGSYDLIPYLKKLSDRIGSPDVMFCMDSGCIDYDSLWLTTSLRGVMVCDLTVECLTESVHSGVGSGICPDSFNVMRNLLDRLDDATHSKMTCLNVEIPQFIKDEAKKLGELRKNHVVDDFVKLSPGVKAIDEDYTEVILNNTWRPTLTVVGMTGFPVAETAGNVLRDKTTCRLSIRLPPTFDAEESKKVVTDILSKDPPFGSKVTVNCHQAGYGWASKDLSPALKASFTKSSTTLFGRDYYCQGEGGSIPFVYDLGHMFPKCELLVTGVLGPLTNAHCPNECLNIDYTVKMTVALAHAVSDYCS